MMTDRDCVEALVEYLASQAYPGLRVVSWPEDANRVSPEVEALCEGDGGVRIAIEHTSVDFVEGQRRVGDKFQDCADRLKAALAERISCRTRVLLPYDAYEYGLKWSKACDLILAWLQDNLDSLPDGPASHPVPELPFEVNVQKLRDRPLRLVLVRYAPENRGLYRELEKRLTGKIAKLARYRQEGYQLILLLETRDLALMNSGIVEEKVTALLDQGRERPDEVWLIETDFEDDLLFYKLAG